MDKVSVALRVFFEDPFFIGICERRTEGWLTVCKITFGAEPKDYEIQEYILKNWEKLKFSPAAEDTVIKVCSNPKRMQRVVKRQLDHIGVGTKSQQALKLQQTDLKHKRVAKKREEKEAENERQFELKQRKRKEKHKGR
jgi:hypothetical protein